VKKNLAKRTEIYSEMRFLQVGTPVVPAALYGGTSHTCGFGNRVLVQTLQPNERHTIQGRAIAQAVSRRLPTAAARVQAQAGSCGICGGQSGTGAGFFRVLPFPLPILISPTTPHSLSSIIRGWYNRPISGRRTKWTQSHSTP
jgi:hypothetical protein